MDKHLAHRTENRYSDAMTTIQLHNHTRTLWVHVDDDTLCEHHEVCTRLTYVRGGRPDFGAAPILGE